MAVGVKDPLGRHRREAAHDDWDLDAAILRGLVPPPPLRIRNWALSWMFEWRDQDSWSPMLVWLQWTEYKSTGKTCPGQACVTSPDPGTEGQVVRDVASLLYIFTIFSWKILGWVCYSWITCTFPVKKVLTSFYRPSSWSTDYFDFEPSNCPMKWSGKVEAKRGGNWERQAGGLLEARWLKTRSSAFLTLPGVVTVTGLTPGHRLAFSETD